MTLGDFINQLVAKLSKENVSIPFENEAPWHFLFFELKRSNQQEKPDFIKDMKFDWDGKFPKSQKLSNYIHSLHWNASVSANNPSYSTIDLSEEITDFWYKEYEIEKKEDDDFFSFTVEKAKEKFGQSV